MEDRNVPVEQMADMEVPTEDNVFGMINDCPSMVFVAHDILAGRYIKEMINDESVYLLYSNGLKIL